jgi:hypothetical protein
MATRKSSHALKEGSGAPSSRQRPLVISDVHNLPILDEMALAPGKERWPVKTGTDDDVAMVAREASPTGSRVRSTVEQLVQLKRPRDMLPVTDDFPAYQRTRARPVETTIFTIECEIIACKIENDGDFHVVVQGDQGKTMIVEVPDPDARFVNPSSPWLAPIKSVRDSVKKVLAPEQMLKKVRKRAQITGVGFFDRVHGQDGVAQTNGIELHPVLGIKWT